MSRTRRYSLWSRDLNRIRLSPIAFGAQS